MLHACVWHAHCTSSQLLHDGLGSGLLQACAIHGSILCINASEQCEGLSMQFLPQDKVASFASLKPEELLKETLTSMGDMEMHNQHQSLIKLQGELRARESVRSWIAIPIVSRLTQE